ncbi:hypothetical protein ACOMHN_019102 [Nucella lapillus]
MAEQVDDSCTADRSRLLTDNRVVAPVHTPPSPVPQQHHPNKDLSDQVWCELTVPKEACSCGRHAAIQHSQDGFWGHRQQKGVLIAVIVFCCLLSICSSVYTFQLSKDSNCREVEDLRQKVQRLGELCGMATHWSASQARVFTDSAGDKSASEHPPGYPWQHNANRPVLRAHEPDSSDKNLKDDQKGVSTYYDDDGEEEDLLYPSFLAKSRTKRNAKGKRARNGNRNSKICKKLDRCIKGKEKGKKVKGKCQRMLTCLPPPPVEKQAALKAMHFTSNYNVNHRQKKFSRVAKTNDVALPPYSETPLHLIDEAEWMGSVYRDRSQQPIVPLRDGGFNITQSGLYFVYSSVMFHDIKPRQSQAVVVNGKKMLKCMDSVDYVNRNQTIKGQHKYKTCTITGVIYMNANDRLEVQNLYAETEIDQAKDATYIGAILLDAFDMRKKP